MRKKLSIVLLGAILLPTSVWAQSLTPYEKKNAKGFTFDGHRLEDVVVKPVGGGGTRTTLDVSQNPDVDKQVVYLYNPKTGRFIYADGSWGTEAVGRYEGFGMPFNIVDPRGSNVENFYYYNRTLRDGDPNPDRQMGGFGMYCEAAEHGHYLGRDKEWYVGSPSFMENGVQKNRARFFVDRGGSDLSTEQDKTIRAAVEGSKRNGELDNVFSWHFEPVDLDDENLHVYRLSIYMPNKRVFGNNDSRDPDYWTDDETKHPFYKHYVKFEKINPYGAPDGFYALTTARWNTAEFGEKGDKSLDGGTEVAPTIHINSDEATPDGDEYYWQIVTRDDLKRKFLLDHIDPYKAEAPVTGNATFNIDNPDFSRALERTVNDQHETGTEAPATFWKEDPNDDVYKFDQAVWNSAYYGRYTFMHPNNNGTLTQTFKPYQYGLFRLDIQGYDFRKFGGEGRATMKLEQVDGNGGVIISPAEVAIPEIKDQDALGIFDNIGNFLRGGKVDYNDWFDRYDYYNKQPIFKYTENSTEYDGDVQKKPGYRDVYRDGNGWVRNPEDYNTKCLYRVRYIDKYGRICKGIYINGQGVRGDKFGPYNAGDNSDRGYGVKINDAAFVDVQSGEPYATIEVNVGDKVVFGPFVSGNLDGNRVQWWTPRDYTDNDLIKTREYTIDKVTHSDAGDYFCTYHTEGNLVDENNKWNVVCYRLVVKDPKMQKDTPTSSYVKFTNNGGLPYYVGNEAPTFEFVDGNSDTYNTQRMYQNGIAATEMYIVERAIGGYLYDDKNAKEYVNSIMFYVPEGKEDSELKITLTFTGISDNLKDVVAIDNMRLTYIGDTPFIFDERDKETTAKSFNTSNKWIPVYLNRHFDEGAWNAFVCPVPLNGGQVKEAFGNDVKVSEISDKGLDPSYPYLIVFDNVPIDLEQTVIHPGHFYLVKPSGMKTPLAQLDQLDATRDGNDNITAISGYRTVSDSDGEKCSFVFLGNHNLSTGEVEKEGKRFPSEVLSSYGNFSTKRYLKGDQEVVHNTIELLGSYVPQDVIDTKNSYVFATKENKTRLVHLKDGSSVNRLQGYRFYIHDIEAVESSTGAKPFTFVVDGVADSDEFSGINSAVSVATDNGDIYTISGQKVNGTLLKGVYVKNGKKFLVK